MAEWDIKILVCRRCSNTGPAVMRRRIGDATFPLCRPCRKLLAALIEREMPLDHFIPT